ncbi:hypothetical protein ACFWVC_38040 [Streptomyces sp. NPDC058691]|uniref:hypothetical protein n=1 Tax=Streptomyces sp. NPDC058691 TaxID=3346601 RepID=UPI003649D0BB
MSKTTVKLTKAPETTAVTTAVPDADAAAAARRARFGALPERVRPEDTTEVIPLIARYPSQDHYDHEKWLTCRFV